MLKFDVIHQEGDEVRAITLTMKQFSPSYNPDLNLKVQREFLQPSTKHLQELLSYNAREILNLKCPEKIKSLDTIKQPFKDSPWWTQLLAQGLSMVGIPVTPYESPVEENPNGDLTEDNLNGVCEKNPLILFSECISDECRLNRLKRPHFRDRFQQVLLKQVRTTLRDITELRVCLHMCGYLLNELAILTELGRYYRLTVDVILDKGEYIQLVTSSQYNPLADQKEISFNSTDPRDDRREWTQALTYRYIKFIEWFFSLVIGINLNLYDSPETFIQSGRTVDLYMGIDYVDESLLQEIPFIVTSLSTTRPGGLIASLRTDGLLSSSTRMTILECPLEVKLPEDNGLTLGNELRRESLVQDDSDIFNKPSNIEKNGVTYHLQESYFGANGSCRTIYLTDRGIQIMELLEIEVGRQRAELFKYWNELPTLVHEWDDQRK